MAERAEYGFDSDRAEEDRRLIAQSRLLEPFSAQTLAEAGLAEGMHVVDLGTGAGDMAMLAARIVGPSGSVVGLERNPESAELARRRVAEAGLSNVTVLNEDVASLGKVLADRPQTDAIVGRCILMWTSDRLEVLRACASAKPGTLVWLFEPDMVYEYAAPSSPAWDLVRGWLLGVVAGIGVEHRMGLRLHGCIRAAGLPAPELRVWVGAYGPATAPVWFWSNIVRGMAPLIEQLGIATAAEIDIDTLEQRLTADLVAQNAAMYIPPCTVAWVRVGS